MNRGSWYYLEPSISRRRQLASPGGAPHHYQRALKGWGWGGGTSGWEPSGKVGWGRGVCWGLNAAGRAGISTGHTNTTREGQCRVALVVLYSFGGIEMMIRMNHPKVRPTGVDATICRVKIVANVAFFSKNKQRKKHRKYNLMIISSKPPTATS